MDLYRWVVSSFAPRESDPVDLGIKCCPNRLQARLCRQRHVMNWSPRAEMVQLPLLVEPSYMMSIFSFAVGEVRDESPSQTRGSVLVHASLCVEIWGSCIDSAFVATSIIIPSRFRYSKITPGPYCGLRILVLSFPINSYGSFVRVGEVAQPFGLEDRAKARF